MTTAATTRRRTVAEMETRLATVTKLIEEMRDSERAKTETESYDDGRTFANGCASGLDAALKFLEWGFAPEQDWMYRD